MKLFKLLVIVLICSPNILKAQKNVNSVGIGLDVNSSIKLSALNSLKPSLKGRFTNLAENKKEGSFFDASGNSRLDIQLLGERTLNEATKAAIGVMYRFGELQNALRIIEQIAWVHNVNAKINFIHRVKADQTFREIDEYRFRYRFGLTTPLKGFRLNKKEKYLLSSVEYLAQFSSKQYSTEMRLKLSLGQLFKNGSKGELGLDLRFDNSNEAGNGYLYLLNFSYFFSLSN